MTSRELETERAILSTMPVLYLPLWKRDGSSIISDDAYGHVCTVIGATWGAKGRDFAGVSDYIALGTNTALKLEDGAALSYIIWIYVHTRQDTALIGAVTSATTSLLLALQGADANFRFNKYGIEYGPASFNVSANTWICCGVSYTINSNLIYYKDGAAHTTTTWAQTFTSAAQKTLGGHYFSGSLVQPFDGVIGEVLGYNYILNPLKMANIYEITKWRYQ